MDGSGWSASLGRLVQEVGLLGRRGRTVLVGLLLLGSLGGNFVAVDEVRERVGQENRDVSAGLARVRNVGVVLNDVEGVFESRFGWLRLLSSWLLPGSLLLLLLLLLLRLLPGSVATTSLLLLLLLLDPSSVLLLIDLS